MADARREVVYQIHPDATGAITASSLVDVAIGDGIGRQENEVGERSPAQTFSLNQPTYIALSDDGYLEIALSYGVVSFDTQAKEAEVLFLDGGRDEIAPFITTTENPSPSMLPISKGMMLSTSDSGVVRITTDLTSSEQDPTRTITHDPSGTATLVDTTRATIDIFDSAGRQIEHRRRTGKTLYKVEYADATSDTITQITNAVGGAFTFQYSNGKVSSITDPAGAVTTITVNGLGDLTQFNLPDGSATTFVYDAHHLTTKTTPFGDTTQITYNDDGTAKTTLRPDGEFHQLQASLATPPTYSANGTLGQSGTYTDAQNVSHTVITNDFGDIETDSYTADGVNYVKQAVLPTVLFDYTEPYVARRQNAIHRVTQWTLNSVPLSPPVFFDSYARVVRQNRNGAGSTNTSLWTFDANGWLSSVTSLESSTTQLIERDTAGHITRMYDVDRQSKVASGRQSVFTWRSDDQPATVTTHNVTTTLSYDDAGGTGNLVSSIDTVGRTMAFGYDARGNVTSTNDGTVSTTAVYDSNNYLVASTDALGNTTTYNYVNPACGCTQDGLLIGLRTPDNAEWSFAYKPLGRIASITDPDAHIETYDYDGPGVDTVGQLKAITDRNGVTTQITHDHLARLASLIDGAGRKHVMSYPIPAAGTWSGPSLDSASADGTSAGTSLSSTLRSGDYQVGANAYDIEGYPAQITVYQDPTFQLAYNQIFDDADRLTKRTDRVGLPLTSTSVSLAHGNFDDHLLSYDGRTAAPLVDAMQSTDPIEGASGAITRNVEFDSTQDAGFGIGLGSPVTHNTTRDVAGRITNSTNQFYHRSGPEVITGPSHSYIYRSDGRIGEINDADGVHDFTYDARGLVTRQDVANEGAYLYGYDSLGRNTSLTFPDGHVRTQQYDALGRLTQRCYDYPDNPSIADRCYGAYYDEVGNVIELTDPEGNDSIQVDDLYRITSVTRGSEVENYTYNAAGALSTNASVAMDHQRPRLDGAGNADAPVAASLGGQPVTLDAGGRITSLRGTSLEFSTAGYLRNAGALYFTIDNENRPVWVDHGDAGPEAYLYEGANRVGIVRPIALPDGTISDQVVDQWLYDGIDHPLRMIHSQLFTPNGVPQTVTIYYELDLAGNVRRIRGSQGEDLGGYRYTAFGQLLEDTATVQLAALPVPIQAYDQSLMWKGRPRRVIGGTEVCDMRARGWVPELGSFLTIDEYTFHDAKTTLWGWPRQNPVRWRDPSGRVGLGDGPTSDALIGAGQDWSDAAFQAGMIEGGVVGAAADLAVLSPSAGFVVGAGLTVSSEGQLGSLGFAFLLAGPIGGVEATGGEVAASATATTTTAEEVCPIAQARAACPGGDCNVLSKTLASQQGGQTIISMTPNGSPFLPTVDQWANANWELHSAVEMNGRVYDPDVQAIFFSAEDWQTSFVGNASVSVNRSTFPPSFGPPLPGDSL